MTEGLKRLSDEWHGCQRCGLHQERPCANIVFGTGNTKARYLFIYESPTEHDVDQSLPFTGREGRVIEDILEEAKVDFRSIFCTALLGCRPTKFQPATVDQEERVLDREPTKEEVEACFPRIQEIIYRVDPHLIFSFGPLAFKTLILPADRTRKLYADAVGDIFLTRVPGRLVPSVPYDVMQLLSIKKILANPSRAKHGAFGTTVENIAEGCKYAQFVEETSQRDSLAAGFGKIQS